MINKNVVKINTYKLLKVMTCFIFPNIRHHWNERQFRQYKSDNGYIATSEAYTYNQEGGWNGAPLNNHHFLFYIQNKDIFRDTPPPTLPHPLNFMAEVNGTNTRSK